MLASLIAELAASETAFSLRRARRSALAYLAAGFAALCGLGFLVAAAFIWAARTYGDIEAAIGFGVGLLVLAGLILLLHRLLADVRSRSDRRRRRSELATLGIAAATAVVPPLLRSKGGIGALLGPVVAFVAYQIYRENRGPAADDDDDGVSGD